MRVLQAHLPQGGIAPGARRLTASLSYGKYPNNALLYRVRLRRLDDLTSTIVWFFLAATLWLLGVLISPAYPWGSKGREIIAAIAETQLTDAAHKRIKELLPQGTTLADASIWPDKAGRQIPDMDPYHFINFPKDANAYDSSGIASCATT